MNNSKNNNSVSVAKKLHEGAISTIDPLLIIGIVMFMVILVGQDDGVYLKNPLLAIVIGIGLFLGSRPKHKPFGNASTTKTHGI